MMKSVVEYALTAVLKRQLIVAVDQKDTSVWDKLKKFITKNLKGKVWHFKKTSI